jgi:hypothetical protein
MACAIVQPILEEPAESGAFESGLGVKTAGFSRFYTKLQHRWATRVVAGTLFEPTQLEIDRRERAERLAGRLLSLHNARARKRT